MSAIDPSRPPRAAKRRPATGAQTAAPPGLPAAPAPAFRSGAVARMAGMPVATLRIWEQRYAAVHPATSPSGHRLYSAADVQRVLLLRALTARGHAIGSIAALDEAQLKQVSAAAQPMVAVAGLPALRVAVVGVALALRLQRPELAARLGWRLRVVAVHETLAEVAKPVRLERAELLLWHAPELSDTAAGAKRGAAQLAALKAAQRACGAGAAAVMYRYAAAPALEALQRAGVAAAREPFDDAGLAAWFNAWRSARPAPREAGVGRYGPTAAVKAAATATRPLPPSRFDDTLLAALAATTPRLACECPRHLAELLMQLASFERYSAGCARRNPADAALHAELERIAGASRVMFEAALERVAAHEGLALG